MHVSIIILSIFASSDATTYTARPSDGAAGLCDCVRKAVHPGDECRLHAGTYEVGPARCELSGVHGTANSPITISSVGDGPVDPTEARMIDEGVTGVVPTE